MPDNLAACHSLIGQLAQTIREQGQTIVSLKQQFEEQQLTINELVQRAFRIVPQGRLDQGAGYAAL